MSYCEACGHAIGPTDRFCIGCGKPIAHATPVGTLLPDRVGVTVPKPDHSTPRPTPARPGRSHLIRNILIGVALVVVVVGVAAILLLPPNPKDSLEKAGAAYSQHDAQAFDNYVDVQSVLNDWTDQGLDAWLIKNNIGVGQSLLANSFVAGAKTLLVPRLARAVENELLSGRIADQPQSQNSDNTTNYLMGFVSSGVRSLVASQLKYEGVVSQTTSGSDAVLDVQVSSPLSRNPLVVKVKMARVGNHWRIVAIQDLAGLLTQMDLTHG